MFGGGGGSGSGSGDVERGRGDGEDGSSESSTFLPSFVRNPFGGGPAAPPPPSEWTCGLTMTQRWQIAALLLVSSAFLFGMSLFVFLPMAVLMPSKFASGITFASLFFMIGLACIRGPRTTVMGFLDRDRALFTSAYLGSLALTLYATLWYPSYFLIIAAIIVQMAALLWYASTFIPGGTTGMSLVTRLFLSSAASSARGVAGMVVGR